MTPKPRQKIVTAPLGSTSLLLLLLAACTSSSESKDDANAQACDVLHDACPSSRGSEAIAACHDLAHDGSPTECAAQLDACILACAGDEPTGTTGEDPLPDPTDTGATDETDGSDESGETGEESGDTDDEPGLPETCWTGERECDPRSAEPCAAGETCDIGSANGMLVLTCFPPPNTAQRGDACDLHHGPFCSAGLVCGPTATCIPFCCADEECTTAGETCEPLAQAYGTLGGCIDPSTIPECSPPGGHCTQPSDCCSNDCHGNHCH